MQIILTVQEFMQNCYPHADPPWTVEQWRAAVMAVHNQPVMMPPEGQSDPYTGWVKPCVRSHPGEGEFGVPDLNASVILELPWVVSEAVASSDRPTSRRRQKVKAWRDLLKQKLSIAGVTPFYMVAAVPDGQHAYSEEQERKFQPQKRYLNHKSALANAWHMCRKFTRPFVVLGVCGIASPVLPDKTERDDEAAEGET